MIDPFNDNDAKNFKRWLQINHETVLEYLKLIGAGIDVLSLSSRAYMMLKIERLMSVADIFQLTEKQLAAYDLSDEKISKEISSHCFYYLKDIRVGLVDYVTSKNAERDEEINRSAMNLDPRELLKEDAFKSDFMKDLILHDSLIEKLDLTNRTYNALKRSRINKMSEAVKLYPDGFDQFHNMGIKTIEEIKTKIEEEAVRFAVKKDEPVSTVLEENAPEIEKKIPQNADEPINGSTMNLDPRELLKEDAFKSDFMKYITLHDYQIEDLDLSVRAYNVLKRSHINNMSDVVKLYPDGFLKLHNMGIKTEEEIKTKIEEEAVRFAVNRDEFVSTINEDDTLEIEEYVPHTVDEALQIPEYRQRINEFFDIMDIRMDDYHFSERINNSLKKMNIHSFTDVLKLYPYRLNDIRGLGTSSLNELENAIEETLYKYAHNINAFFIGDNSAAFDDEFVCSLIVNKYGNYKPFYGISIDEFKEGLPEPISDTHLKKCIGKLLSKKKLEYVDFRCYKVYPSFFDIANEIAHTNTTDRGIQSLIKQLSGMTLEQIGKGFGVTRERARQMIGKAYIKVSSYAKKQYGTGIFDEDYYAYLYEKYDISEKIWIDDIGVTENTYQYLKRYCSSAGSKNSMENALEDDNVSVSLKYKIIDAINKKKIEIDGIMFEPKRSIIEDYIIYKYCRDDIVFDDYCNLYNRILKENNVPDITGVYYTEDVKNTRYNRLSESHNLLWKQGKRLRYYDIDAKDYQELLNTIGIYSYHNTGLSTLFWINNFPEIMEKYDIRDQYELHNLLKKIIPEGSINGIHFDRNPGIVFGAFDMAQVVYELMSRYSPIPAEDLAEVFYNEYGYDKGSCLANYFKPIRQYYHNGIYSVDFKSIPDDRVPTFLNVLSEDLYFDSEVRDIYSNLYPDADLNEINPRSMQEIGFTAYARYYLKDKWPSLREFFTYILTKDELFDYLAYNKRYGYIQLYTGTFRTLRASFDLFITDDGTALTIDRLAKANINKHDIRDYCESVDQFVGDSSFFTLRSLEKAGFKDPLENLGFDNSFYERILELCGYFNATHCENVMILAKGEGTTNFTKKDFILSVVSNFRSITIDDLVEYIADEYGIKLYDKYKLTALFANTDVYYDQIMDTVYANKEVYYDELG